MIRVFWSGTKGGAIRKKKKKEGLFHKQKKGCRRGGVAAHRGKWGSKEKKMNRRGGVPPKIQGSPSKNGEGLQKWKFMDVPGTSKSRR